MPLLLSWLFSWILKLLLNWFLCVSFSPGAIWLYSSGTRLDAIEWFGEEARKRISSPSSHWSTLWQIRTERSTILGTDARYMRWRWKFLSQLFRSQSMPIGIFPRLRPKFDTSWNKGKKKYLNFIDIGNLEFSKKKITIQNQFFRPIRRRCCRRFAPNIWKKRLT